ncbi:MAG: hypothetical protein WC879_17385 [Melioribacteraceae bacterium]
MKTTIVLLGILSGYFFPNYTFSIILFLAAISFSFVVGFVFSDMMNANSLSSKVDREKVTLKSKISIYKMNTISLWVGVFVFCVAITSVIKHILLNAEVNQLSIIILAFSFGIFIKLLNINRSISKFLKQ